MPVTVSNPSVEQVVEGWLPYFKKMSKSRVIPGVLEVDDCIQECCILLIEALSEIDPTDPDFDNRIKARITNRLVNKYRHHTQKQRDYRKETSLPDEEIIPDNHCEFGQELVDLRDSVEAELTPQQMLVWEEMINPSERIFKISKNRSGSIMSSCYNIPVTVLAEATGLSYYQARYAVEVIRGIAQQHFSLGV